MTDATQFSIRLYLLCSHPKLVICEQVFDLSKLDARDLLIYLMDGGSSTHSRTPLSNLLYDGLDPSDPMKRLREAIYHVRNKVGLADQFPDKSEAGTLHYHALNVWVDARAFEQEARALLEKGNWDDSMTLCRRLRALRGYRYGHFLHDTEFRTTELKDWHAARQRELADLYHALLEQTVKYLIVHDHFKHARRTATQWHKSAVAIKDVPGAVLHYLIWLAGSAGKLSVLERLLVELKAIEADSYVYRTSNDWQRVIERGSLPKSLLPLYQVNRGLVHGDRTLIERDAVRNSINGKLLDAYSAHHFGIVGLPGVGKSALAAAIAADLPGAFPVVWLVATRDIDYAGLINAALRQTGVTAEQLTTLNAAEKHAALRTTLRGRRHLVVIDESTPYCLMEETFFKQIMALFADAHLLLVAQTLPDLDVDLDRYEIDGLTTNGVREFLRIHAPDLAQEALPLFEAVADATKGLPLALSLLAGSFQHKRFGLRKLAEHLLALAPLTLTPDMTDQLYERILQWIWNFQLSERAIFYILSLYDAQMGATQAEIVWLMESYFKLNPARIIEICAASVALRLVNMRTEGAMPRYALHPIVQRFVLEQSQNEKTNLFDAIEGAFVTLWVEAIPKLIAQPAQLDAHRATIATMLERVIGDGRQPNQYAQVVVCFDLLYPYFQQRGQIAFIEHLNTAILAADNATVNGIPLVIRTRLLANAGQTAFKMGNYEAAQRYLDEALATAQQEEWIDLYPTIMRDLGRNHIQHKNYAAAADYFNAAAQIAHDTQQWVLYWQIRANIGVIARNEARYADAQLEFAAILTAIGDENQPNLPAELLDVLQFVLNALGIIALDANDLDEAEAYFHRNTALLARLGNTERLCYAYINLAALYISRKKIKEALALYEAGSAMTMTLLNDELRLLFDWHLGETYGMLHRYEDAYRLLDQARDKAQAIQLAWALPGIVNAFGTLYLRQGMTAQAARQFVHVLQGETSDARFAAEALYCLMLIWHREHGAPDGSAPTITVAQVDAILATYRIDPARIPAFRNSDIEKAASDIQRMLNLTANKALDAILKALMAWNDARGMA